MMKPQPGKLSRAEVIEKLEELRAVLAAGDADGIHCVSVFSERHRDVDAALGYLRAEDEGWRDSRSVPVDDGEAAFVLCDGSPYMMHYRAEHNLWEDEHGDLYQVSHVMKIPKYRHLFPLPEAPK